MNRFERRGYKFIYGSYWNYGSEVLVGNVIHNVVVETMRLGSMTQEGNVEACQWMQS